MSTDFDLDLDFDVEFDLGFLAFASPVREDAARFLSTSAATSDISGRGDAVADDILPDLRSDILKIERASIQEMLNTVPVRAHVERLRAKTDTPNMEEC
jgi:hypothetical protein